MEGRDFGVLASIVLLLDNGRSFGVVCMFCKGLRGCFLMVEAGLASDDVLLGVVVALVAMAALTLLLPGAVIDPRCAPAASLLGVVGAAWGVPSLVIGLLPFPNAEAGLSGGGMDLSPLKKLDLRLVLLPAGDEGSCERLSIVLSDRDGRAFLGAGFAASVSFSCSRTCSTSSSRNPALEPARDDAREAERNPSKSPSTSSL